MLVTFKEFAAIKGVSAAAVSQAIKARIVSAVVEENGRRYLDKDKALELWDRNTMRNGSERVSAGANRKARRKPRAAAVHVPEVSSEQLRTMIQGLPEDQIPGLDVSRERKEHYNAEIARLQALKERGELVPTKDVQLEARKLGAAIRDNVMAIPNRVSPRLAATQDSREVQRVLTEELRTALRVLADG
jgi:phage terminase Nu1 subunit (DNA packaging protein)